MSESTIDSDPVAPDSASKRPSSDAAPVTSPRVSAESIAGILALVVSVLAVGVTVWRVFYGADFIDEAFYAAMAYRFAMGAHPLIGQTDPHQLASLLVTPYVRLHLSVFGDTTGILLSLRMLWLTLNAIAATLWFFLLSRTVDRRLAMLASATAFSFIPYMIPAPSFNTLPVLFGSAALALIGFGVTARPRWWLFVTAGMLLGLATFAYPTVVVSALFAVAGVAWLTRSWREPVLVAGGGLAVALAGFLYLLPYRSGIPKVLELTSQAAALNNWAGANGIQTKIWQVLSTQTSWGVLHLSLYLALVCGALALMRRRVRWWLLSALVVSLPIAATTVVQQPDVRTLLIATSVMVAAALAILPQREGLSSLGTYDRFFRFALVYGLVSGAVFALTSSQSFLFLGLGAITVMCPVLALLYASLNEALVADGKASIALLVVVAAAAFLPGGLMFYNATGYYRDAPPAALPVQVKTGPHAGLMTTELNAENTEGLWAAMQKLSGPKDRLLSFQGFPVGYLYTTAEPSLSNLWQMPADAMGAPSITRGDLATLNQPDRRPTVVIRNLGWPSAWVFQMQNPSMYDPTRDGVAAFVDKNYQVAAQGHMWQVLVPAK